MADFPANAPAKRDPILFACITAGILSAIAGLSVLGWMVWAAATGWGSLLSIASLLLLAGT